MAKVLISTKVYLWPKDEETGETRYSLYTDEEYKQECDDYGVDSLDDVYLDYDRIVEQLRASEDSYASSGESLSVIEIPDEKYDEVNKLIELYHETGDKIRRLCYNSIK